MFPGTKEVYCREIATAGFQPVETPNAPEIKGDFYAEFSVVKDQPSWAPTVRIGNGGLFDARRARPRFRRRSACKQSRSCRP